MVGSYTAFEVEAERRREVLADSMRDSRGNQATNEDNGSKPSRGKASDGHGLTGAAASLLNRIAQRV